MVEDSYQKLEPIFVSAKVGFLRLQIFERHFTHLSHGILLHLSPLSTRPLRSTAVAKQRGRLATPSALPASTGTPVSVTPLRQTFTDAARYPPLPLPSAPRAPDAVVVPTTTSTRRRPLPPRPAPRAPASQPQLKMASRKKVLLKVIILGDSG